MEYMGMWRWFPEIGVPPVLIHLNGIFHYEPSICTPLEWKPPYMDVHPSVQVASWEIHGW